MRKLRQLIRAGELAGDRSGIAAVEFAVLLPVLLTLFIGSYETSGLLIAYLKLEAAAETAADLVAQTPANIVLQSTDFDSITNAVNKVMTPLSTTNLRVAYASVTYDTNNSGPKVDWHYEENSATAITYGSLPNGVSATSMGSASSGSTDSVIVVQLTYPYTSPLSGYFNTNYTLVESAFNRPRYVDCVPTTLATGGSGGTCP